MNGRRFVLAMCVLLALAWGCKKKEETAAEPAPAAQAPAVVEERGTSMTLPSEGGTTSTQTAAPKAPTRIDDLEALRERRLEVERQRAQAAPPLGRKTDGAGGTSSAVQAAPPVRPTSTGAEVSASAGDEVDNLLKSLRQASIAFNAPKTLNIHDVAQIQLLLSLRRSTEDLKKSITMPGERLGAKGVKVSNRMQATLTGSQFTITSITGEEQRIDSDADTEWRWEVVPKETGTLMLHLTLTALFEVDGVNTRKSIKTFDQSIEVQVTGMQTFKDFIQKNWQWIVTALLIPFALWVLKNWFGKKQKGRTKKRSKLQ